MAVPDRSPRDDEKYIIVEVLGVVVVLVGVVVFHVVFWWWWLGILAVVSDVVRFVFELCVVIVSSSVSVIIGDIRIASLVVTDSSFEIRDDDDDSLETAT
jgi:hypothetical protein